METEGPIRYLWMLGNSVFSYFSAKTKTFQELLSQTKFFKFATQGERVHPEDVARAVSIHSPQKEHETETDSIQGGEKGGEDLSEQQRGRV